MVSEAGVMEQHQNQQQSLKCPRCDSSNTKFCYYNNYSLSQPRHFCKACKRYWTRGGSLRKVPVGGGCRKNKRVKMLPNATTTTHVASSSQPVVNNPNPNSNPNFDNLSSFHGLIPQNHDYQRPFNSGCDFSQHQISNLGLGFSSSNATAASVANPAHNSSLILSSSSSDPTMASLLNSGFQQPQRYMDWSNNFEEQNNDDRLEAMASSDPNSLIWNTSSGGGGGWFDHTSNIEYSSLASLI